MARRISGSSVNWEAIANFLGPEEKAAFFTFKAKTDKYLKNVVSKSAELPKINWNFYKARITTPGFVESFQKSYESFQIPYPSDQGHFSKLESQEKSLYEEYKKDMKQLDEEIAKSEAKLKELAKVIPYSEMCMEEYFVARPEIAIRENDDRMWPQNFTDEEILKKKLS